MDILIRSERPADKDPIEKVTFAAFAGKPYSSGTEHLIVDELRKARALALSLVAEYQGNVVGHVGFSSVTINEEDLNWYGLGPVSVSPEFQGQRIGSKLIKEGLTQIREQGAQGCVLEGNPVYYQKFGFKTYPGLFYAGAPAPKYFMALPFYDEIPDGKVEFHKSFYMSAD
jgi:putative acetyltransferase